MRCALAAVLRNEAIIVLPSWWKSFWYLERLSPTLSLRDKMRADLLAAGGRPR